MSLIIDLSVCLKDDLTGVVVFESKSESRHEGISITIEANVNMQLSSKNVGIFEAFYNSVKVFVLNKFKLLVITHLMSYQLKAGPTYQLQRRDGPNRQIARR